VDVEEGTMPGSLVEAPATSKGIGSVLRWRPSNATKGKANDESKEKLTAAPLADEKRPERGKFIEDVSSSGLGEQNKGGTLKKRSMK
jgi:hypothetical protein